MMTTKKIGNLYSTKIIPGGSQIISIGEELKKLNVEISPDEKILVREAYFLKDSNTAFVVVELVGFKGDLPSTDDNISIRYNREWEDISVEFIIHKQDKKNYLQDLQEKYKKEVICFYHYDDSFEKNKDIFIRFFPYSFAPFGNPLNEALRPTQLNPAPDINSNKKSTNQSDNKSIFTKGLMVGGFLLFAAAVVNTLKSTENIADHTFNP